MQVSQLSWRTDASPPCLPLDIKDSMKEDGRIFDGDGGFMEGFSDEGLIGGLL
jgi:hypothetical protein